MAHSSDLQPAVPAILSDLFAVVLLSHWFGAVRVKWREEDSAWLISSPYGPGFFPQRTNADVDGPFPAVTHAPSEEDLQTAARLAERFIQLGECSHCGRSELAVHAIVPDVFGDSVIVCVCRPDPTIVNSSGLGGRKKHYGGPWGCRAVQGSEEYRRDSYLLRSGYFFYGQPMTVFQVINWDWCARCANTAHVIREHQREKLRDELGQEPTAAQVRTAVEKLERQYIEADRLRHLLNQIEGRSHAQLVREMRQSTTLRVR